MTKLDAAILRKFVESIRVPDTYTTDEQQKRVKIHEIEIVYNFIGALILRERGSNAKLPKTIMSENRRSLTPR